MALLRALALVVAELEEVPDAALAACLAVARRLAGVYAGLYAGQRAATHAAMAALLHALAPRAALLAGAAPQLVAAVLEATLRPAGAAGTSCASNFKPKSKLKCKRSICLTRGMTYPGVCCARAAVLRSGSASYSLLQMPLRLVLLRGQGESDSEAGQLPYIQPHIQPRRKAGWMCMSSILAR